MGYLTGSAEGTGGLFEGFAEGPHGPIITIVDSNNRTSWRMFLEIRISGPDAVYWPDSGVPAKLVNSRHPAADCASSDGADLCTAVHLYIATHPSARLQSRHSET